MQNVEVSVIYVNYNCAKSILKSIDSVKSNTSNVSYEIIVVDNNSTESLKTLINKCKVIKNKKNFGFGTACNIGAKHSKGDYLLFLNPDTILQTNCIKTLKDFLKKRPDTAAAGCLTIEGDRENAPGGARTFHTILTELLERFNISERFFKNPYYMFWNFNSTRKVDALIGSCIMIKKTIFEKIGGFDEKFFLYYEDVDLCKRLWDNGFKVYFLHNCSIFHKGGESINSNYKNEHILYINMQSAYTYFNKHFGKFYGKLWFVIITSLYYLKYLLTQKKIFLNLSKWRPELD